MITTKVQAGARCSCMTWAGTGVLWSVAGGVPTSLGIIDQAAAQQSKGFTLLQISDSHMGFDKLANPNTKGTLEEARAGEGTAGQAVFYDPYR